MALADLRSTSLEGIAQQWYGLVQAASLDLFRVRGGAADAAAAASRLRGVVDRAVALCAGLVCAAPALLAEASVMRLDTLERATAGPAHGGHWAFCCQQMWLAPRQELIAGKLLDRYDSFNEELLRRRRDVIRSYQHKHGRQQEERRGERRCHEATQDEAQWPPEPEGHHGQTRRASGQAFWVSDHAAAAGLLADLERLQTESAWTSAAFFVALVTGILEPDQVASAMVGCYPYMLSLQGVREGLGRSPQ